jgi:hypothetical protein
LTVTSTSGISKSKRTTSQSAAKNFIHLARERQENCRSESSAMNWRSVIHVAETVTAIKRTGIACVDLDSVLLHHNSEDGISHLGRPLHLGRMLTWLLSEAGFKVIVLTSRPGRYNHGKIHQYLVSQGFSVDRVTNVKPPADCYWDDRAVRVPKNWKP